MKAEIGKHYAHYKKSDRYTVIAIGYLESSPTEEYVVYRAAYGEHAVWIRPRKEFESSVTHDGRSMERFIEVDF